MLFYGNVSQGRYVWNERIGDKIMDGNKLQALRKVLFLSEQEAATLIGGVTTRTWQYWENGKKPVPQDVETKILEVVNEAETIFKAVLEEGFEYTYQYFDFDDFKKRFKNDKLLWRVYQSILGRLHQTLGDPLKDVVAPEDCALYKAISNLEINASKLSAESEEAVAYLMGRLYAVIFGDKIEPNIMINYFFHQPLKALPLVANRNEFRKARNDKEKDLLITNIISEVGDYLLHFNNVFIPTARMIDFEKGRIEELKNSK